MAKTGERRDPELVALFHVEIEGIDGAAFSKCSGLKTETEVFELQEGGENSLVRKLIGQSRASNIVLTSGFVNAAALSDWREQVVNSGEKVRKSGSIIQYDSKMNEVVRWRFFNAIPIRWELGEFDLDHLEYVVIEEEEQVVVVSDFGQFALANDRPAQQAIAAAVVRDRSGLEQRAVGRSSSEPRAYLVRQDGDLVVLDVQKLAAAIARLPVRQVSAPAVERPPIRLLPFEPRPRPMTRRSEARALRENDRRMSLPVPPP